jgi:3-oxoadipate enol-lactonase
MKALTLTMLSGTLFLVGGCSDANREKQPPAVSPVQTGYADVGETKLYYEEMGQGQPLMMLHGGLLDRRMWDPQFEVFAHDYRVIRYDVRNHGNSKGVPGTFTHYDDLLKLLEHLSVEKAVIMGLSLGGRIAIDFAIAYPDKVSALILVSPGASGYEFVSEAVKENSKQMNSAFREGDLEKAVEYFQRSWTDGPHREPSEVDPAVREKVKGMALATVQNWNPESEVKELEPPAIGRLAEIQAPTLVVVGDLDMPGILEIADEVKENVTGSEVVVLAGAAHMVNMEQPQAFNNAVQGFLARIVQH